MTTTLDATTAAITQPPLLSDPASILRHPALTCGQRDARMGVAYRLADLRHALEAAEADPCVCEVDHDKKAEVKFCHCAKEDAEDALVDAVKGLLSVLAEADDADARASREASR